MITIVTDSSVEYSKAEADSRAVKVVPLYYSISGISFTESFRGDNGNYFSAMQGKLLKTSQPSPDDFSEIFAKGTVGSNTVLCITLSQNLSGTYSAASLAAKEFGNKVKVIDSETTSGGLHLLVDEAVNMVVGGMNITDIAEGLEQIKTKINTVFTVETLEPLRKGGRLVLNQAPSTMLNSRPILTCAGSIKFIENVRGAKAQVAALTEAMPADVRRIFVMKTGNETSTEALEQALKARYGGIKIHLRVCGPVLTAHLGGGALGIAYITK